MIWHHTDRKQVVSLGIEMRDCVQHNRSSLGEENAAFPSRKTHVINSVWALVVWQTSFPVSRAVLFIRQHAGGSGQNARAPRRASRLHHSRDFAFEQFDALIQRAVKGFFFAADRLGYRLLLFA